MNKLPFAPVVLCIDDEESVIQSIQRALRAEGYEFLSAHDGASALQILHERHVDLAILDLQMPEMAGTEVLERLRRTGMSVEVIVLTASDDVKTAVRCMKLGASDFMQKPYEPEDLRHRIRELLEQRLIRSKRKNWAR